MEDNILNQEEEELLNSVLEAEHNEIPINSNVLNIDTSTLRFKDALWYDKVQDQNITIAGIGGIGSFLTLLLSRLKPHRIAMYDPDRVEEVNLAGQLYSTEHIGYYKTTALSSVVHKYSDYFCIDSYSMPFETNTPTTDIMMCGFDNMSARKTFYEAWLRRVSKLSEDEKKKCLYIDGRLATEEFQVLSIQGDDTRAMEEYEAKWLFSDNEAETTTCSYKQTTYTASMIASMMVNVFVNFITNQCGYGSIREVPFLISYNAGLMFTKIEV